jgi:multidrug efflux system outer membrane protein
MVKPSPLSSITYPSASRGRNAMVLAMTGLLSACSLSPDFIIPDANVPAAYKEESPTQASWQPAASLAKEDRGAWWTLFADDQLNDLEKQAADANQSLKAAAARVTEARSTARASIPSFLPDLDIGANAVRTQPANASLAAFGQPGARLKPYNLYNAQGVISYEADIFGRVSDNYKALEHDADAQEAAYRSALLALQADVAQAYFSLRELDAERALLRDTAAIREEAARIVKKRFDAGEAAQQDNSRAQADLATVQATAIALDQQRAATEHTLAVLLGKMPAEFTFAPSPLAGMPPEIPASLPSTLLERRPDIATAQFNMAAANLRIGVARTAFFPSLSLTATGGFESTQLGDLFLWSSRTWALGQLANTALSMPIFDSGRNLARLDVAHAQYDEAVANYRQQVLVAFRDVEDNLSAQKLLAEQSAKADDAAQAASLTTKLTRARYDQGDVDFFQVVSDQRDSLSAERAAVQTRGQRFQTTVALVRALGGGWDSESPTQPGFPAP